MTERFVTAWWLRNWEGQIVLHDLIKTKLPFVTPPWLQACSTLSAKHLNQMHIAFGQIDAESFSTTDKSASPICILGP